MNFTSMLTRNTYEVHIPTYVIHHRQPSIEAAVYSSQYISDCCLPTRPEILFTRLPPPSVSLRGASPTSLDPIYLKSMMLERTGEFSQGRLICERVEEWSPSCLSDEYSRIYAGHACSSASLRRQFPFVFSVHYILSLRIPLTLARPPVRTMDNDMPTFDAILFPADDCPPHVGSPAHGERGPPACLGAAAPGGALPLWPRPASRKYTWTTLPTN